MSSCSILEDSFFTDIREARNRDEYNSIQFNSIQFNSLLQTKSPYTSTYIYK